MPPSTLPILPGGESAGEVADRFPLPKTTSGRRSLIWLVGSAIVLLVVSVLGFAIIARWMYELHVEDRLANAERVLQSAKRYVDEQYLVLDTVSRRVVEMLDGRNPADISVDEALAIKKQVETPQAEHQLEIFIWLPDGYNVLFGNKGPNISDREYFRVHFHPEEFPDGGKEFRHAETGLVIGGPVFGRIRQIPVLPVSRAVLDASGKPVGIITATVPVHRFLGIFDYLRREPNDVIFLMRNDYLGMVREPNDQRFLGSKLPNALVFQHYPERIAGRFEGVAATDGVRRVGAHLGLAPLPLVLGHSLEVRALGLDTVFFLSPVLAVSLGNLLAAFGFAIVAFFALKRSLADSRGLAQERDRVASSELRLASVINGAMDAIITLDETYHIVLFNDAAAKMFGMPSASAIGRLIDEFIPHRFRPQHAAHIRQFAAQGSASARMMGSVGSISAQRANGEEFPVEASISRVETGGQKLLTVTLRDVSRQRLLEEQLHQSQKMEALGQLTGGVAHDFNNLLAVILGNAEMVRDIARDRPDIGDKLESIIRASERAAALTRSLLAFSRQQALESRTLDPRKEMRETLTMLRRMLPESISIALDDRSTWLVKSDAAQLQAAILNLAVNARDAMPQGGTLTFGIRDVPLNEEYAASQSEVHPGQYVMITVTDTGEGMPAQVKARAFEPFFTTKEIGKGSGLGLSMVYGFAKQSHGHVEIDSEPNQGTTVRLYLPRGEDQIASSGGGRAEGKVGNGQLVLVVEDDADVRALATKLLEELGFIVLSASDAEQALGIVRDRTDIVVVLTDLIMPGRMNGQDLAREATRLRPKLAVIFMSGYTKNILDSSKESELQWPLLQKPFFKRDLADVMRSTLASATTA